jgi:hypothetical protein
MANMPQDAPLRELLKLIGRTSASESRFKHSMLKDSKNHLEYQLFVCRQELAILTEVDMLVGNSDMDMRDVQSFLSQRLASVNDTLSLQSLYDLYEKSYIEQNKLLNQKRLEYLLHGGGLYLDSLKTALKGNQNLQESSQHKLSLPFQQLDQTE